MKYSESNTEIQIRVSTKEDNIIIEIEDQGIGINKKDLARIFDRFYRGDNTFVNKEDGEGLGLSIVKKIIDIHNGTIKVESEVGKGTLFTITIPQIYPS